MRRSPRDTGWREQALERIKQITEIPLLILAVAMVPLIVVPLTVNLSDSAEDALLACDWFIWGVFAATYVTRLALSRHRLRFVRQEWAELLIVVIPFLRPLRLLRSVRVLRTLRLVRLVGVVGEVAKKGKRLLVRHRLHYAVLVGIVIVVASAAIITVVERNDSPNIRTFGDGLWWAVTTITTVGYGDTYPVTDAGRAIAMFLMVMGIAFFGIITANIAAFFIEQSEGPEPSASTSPASDVIEEIRRLGELREAGFLSQREFASKKKDLLARI